jgi:hypothetical protein
MKFFRHMIFSISLIKFHILAYFRFHDLNWSECVSSCVECLKTGGSTILETLVEAYHAKDEWGNKVRSLDQFITRTEMEICIETLCCQVNLDAFGKTVPQWQVWSQRQTVLCLPEGRETVLFKEILELENSTWSGCGFYPEMYEPRILAALRSYRATLSGYDLIAFDVVNAWDLSDDNFERAYDEAAEFYSDIQGDYDLFRQVFPIKGDGYGTA